MKLLISSFVNILLIGTILFSHLMNDNAKYFDLVLPGLVFFALGYLARVKVRQYKKKQHRLIHGY